LKTTSMITSMPAACSARTIARNSSRTARLVAASGALRPGPVTARAAAEYRGSGQK
jgi:hypothetical protein